MFGFVKDFVSRSLKKREFGKKGLINSRKRRKTGETFAHIADQSKFLGFSILFLLWVVCVLILTLPNPKNNSTTLVPSQRAPKSVFASFDFTFEDIDRTREKKDQALSKVPLFFKVDQDIVNATMLRAKDIFDEIQKRSAVEKNGQVYSVKPDNIISQYTAELDKRVMGDIAPLLTNMDQQKNYIAQLNAIIDKGIMSQKDKETYTYGQEIRIIDVKNRIKKPILAANVLSPAEASEKTADEAMKFFSHGDRDSFKKTLSRLGLFIIGDAGNLVPDEKATQEARQDVDIQVKPVMLEIKKGQPIIIKDQVVDNEDIRRVKLYEDDLNKKMASVNFWEHFQKSAVFCLFLMIITALYLYHIHPEVTRSSQKIWIITLSVIIAILINYFSMKIFNSLSPEFNIPPLLVMRLMPIALASVLLSVLIGLRVALYGGLFVSLITSLMLDNSFGVMIEGLTVSCLAGFMVRNSTNYRSYFLRVLFGVPLSLIILDGLMVWELSDSVTGIFGWTVTISIANALLTAMLSLLVLFFFESIFQVSTNMALLSLCDYNHPLLKRLQLEAPGTYHHSIMVSTLSERAAEEIGANPIKARVCSLFHDIGKLAQPEYFAENNLSGENKHAELHPRMSAMIIINHVKEGIDMAINLKLRKIIRDTIEQHHGTDLVYYFYKRAIDENPDKSTPIDEQEYRYQGPLPEEKEVAIVSLADACEAASRSIQKPTPSKIDDMVWELFRKRIRDGQLDDAELTFGEMAVIRESFVKTLSTMMHGRIAYPKEEDEEEEENEDDLFVAAKKTSASKQETTE